MKKFEELARMEEEFAKSSNSNINNNAAASTSTSETASGTPVPESGAGNGEGSSSSVNPNGEVILGLESTQQKAGESEGFTDEQLQEIFRRTSGFTVRSMLRDTPEDIYEEDVWQANIADEDYLYDFEEEE